jgi:hypothetical protein
MSGNHAANNWAKYSARYRPSVKACLPSPCVNDCQYGGIVYPGQPFDVGHIVGYDRGGSNDRSNVGAAHVKCNRSDGGKIGASITNAAKRSSRLSGKKIRAW